MNSKKGKAKENDTEPSSKHILGQGVTTSSHERKEVPWNWTTVMSPVASKVTPIFTKDGRCVSNKFKTIVHGKIYAILPATSCPSSDHPYKFVQRLLVKLCLL